MGFQPSKTYPVKFSVAGVETSMSIASAETHLATVRALIAEAKLVEAREYLSYRCKQHDADMAALRERIDAEAARANKAEKRARRSR